MDRIFFEGNPWPNGHRIRNFTWNGHFKVDEAEEDRVGLYFDFHLETADYYEEDADDEEEQDLENITDWEAKIVWSNYHSCTFSSEEWDYKGFRVATEHEPFDLDKLDGRTYKVDFLPEEEIDLEKTAFDIYLLGHDASAYHTITFTKIDGNQYQIDWNGKIANVYAGYDEFQYNFHTKITTARLDKIEVPTGYSDEEALQLFARYVKQPERFELVGEPSNRYFRLKD